MTNKIKIKKTEENQRLDIFLAGKLEISRAKAQKMIKIGEVLVNDKKIKPHYLLKENNKITITPANNTKKQILASPFPLMDIIAETADYLIINKQAGVVVHGGEGIDKPTLTDALINKYPEISAVGDNPTRPGIVHRLDKEASGLMVIAKNNKMFALLKEQFQKQKVAKKYTALVYGKIGKESEEIGFPIARSAKGYKMAAHSKNQGGRNAVTEFTAQKKFINYTLLKVKIKTGRTHQIRVHMSAYGHPVVGDNLYGTKKTKEQNKKLGSSRIFLHAEFLGFKDLQNKQREFKSKLPAEFKKILREIK